MSDLLEIFIEIPTLSLLVDNTIAPKAISEQVALTIQKLAYQPEEADIWNLPAEQPSMVGVLDREGALPLMRCKLPLPEPGEIALYRVSILKTGAALDAQGKTRAEQLLPTEEELLFFMVGASEGSQVSQEEYQRLIPGIQCVVVPQPTQ